MRLVYILQAVRTIINMPLIIDSGVRCKAHNEAIGGAPESWHVEGMAVDIKCVASNIRYRFVREFMLQGVSAIKIYPTHIHIDLRPIRFPIFIA